MHASGSELANTSGRLSNSLLFVASLIAFLSYSGYIVLITISCLIDETNVIAPEPTVNDQNPDADIEKGLVTNQEQQKESEIASASLKPEIQVQAQTEEKPSTVEPSEPAQGSDFPLINSSNDSNLIDKPKAQTPEKNANEQASPRRLELKQQKDELKRNQESFSDGEDEIPHYSKYLSNEAPVTKPNEPPAQAVKSSGGGFLSMLKNMARSRSASSNASNAMEKQSSSKSLRNTEKKPVEQVDSLDDLLKKSGGDLFTESSRGQGSKWLKKPQDDVSIEDLVKDL
jgi:hypothetical protein